MMLGHLVKVLLPVAKSSDPPEEGKGVDAADVFKS